MSGASLRGLITRLIDEGKAYVIAELAVAKAMVQSWLKLARIVVPLVVVAVFLLQAALVVLVAALGMLLARWIGPAGGLAVAALITIAIAGLLVKIAVDEVSKAPK